MRRATAWILAGGAALLVAGCGSQKSEMERGVTVDQEVAAPESDKQLDMTDEERKAKENAEVENREAEIVDETQE
jgi:hypothetical protein